MLGASLPAMIGGVLVNYQESDVKNRAIACLVACVIASSLSFTAPRTVSAGDRSAIAARSNVAAPKSLVMYKRFGAALRSAPSSNAKIVHTMPCGTTMRVLGQHNGWYRVTQGSRPYNGWVGGARVADSTNAPAYDCTDAYTFQPYQHGYTYVKTGCLSLRSNPSRAASYAHCVGNLHDYIVTNGPIEVAGEDWFGVYSRSTGGGWVLAVYLLPYRQGGDVKPPPGVNPI
jgi:Bacterial SH3 domain